MLSGEGSTPSVIAGDRHSRRFQLAPEFRILVGGLEADQLVFADVDHRYGQPSLVLDDGHQILIAVRKRRQGVGVENQCYSSSSMRSNSRWMMRCSRLDSRCRSRRPPNACIHGLLGLGPRASFRN